MIAIRKSADVNTSPEQVFTLLTDLDRLPEWSTVTVATHDAPSGELRQGDTFRQTLRVVGKQIDAQWTVTELDRPRHVAYEATGPAGAWLRMAQTVESSSEGSRVSVEIDYELPGGAIGGVASSLMERRNEREVEHSLHNLADLAES
jgi:uncharacterized protein YndB with AHSA1/START domain